MGDAPREIPEHLRALLGDDAGGLRDELERALGRGAAKLPKDEKLQDSLQTLQNGKKLKLWKLYDMQWFQFGLEAPPQVDPSGGRARRQVFRRR